uniref:Acyl-CoA-binding domain-containing protein 6 n=1 Tax=Hymenolepis diminuta TaxID=6216 RepID=A0A158QDV2_HYMDI
LNGAIDIIVVEGKNGCFKSGPFYIRFGKMGAINPTDKHVEIYVNGRSIDDVHMRLGSNGLAYFVNDMESLFLDSDSESTNRLIRTRSVDSLNDEILASYRVRRRFKKSRIETAVSICEASPSINPSDSISPSGYLSDGDIETIRHHVSFADKVSPCDVVEPVQKDLTPAQPYPGVKSSNSNLGGIYLDELVAQSADQSIRDTYLYSSDCTSPQPNQSDAGYKSDSEQTFQKPHIDVQMSLCGGLSADAQVDYERFCAHMVTFEEFSKDPAGIVNNPNLVLAYNGKFYNWQTAAPLILSRVCFMADLPYNSLLKLVETFMPKKQLRQRRRAWFTWGTTDPPEPSSESEKTPVKSPVGLSVIDNPSIPDPSDPHTENPKPPKRNTPTEGELELFDLQPGVNDIEFRVVTKYQGTAVCHAKIYLWRWDEKIVVSDVDGTITKSDFLGHVIPALFNSDYGHDGVAELYSKVAENGYKFVYLTARAVSQADTTRSYLGRVCQYDKFRLPDGPVLLSPTSTLDALHREIIAKTPEVFKISCLKELRDVFPADSNPFYAAFGNRPNDVTAYIESGFDPGRIFTVNPSGELKNERIPCVKKSFCDVTSLVDHFFPCIGPKPLDVCGFESEDDSSAPINAVNNDVDMTVYSSFTFWRDPLPIEDTNLDTNKQSFEAIFSRATKFIPEIVESLSNEDLMYLYARYKQATEGPCNISQPGLLQYKARAKWNAWKELGNLSAEEAMQQYVQKVTELAPNWTNKVSNQVSGPRVSRPMFAEENSRGDTRNQKSTPLIETVKDGKLGPVVEYIRKNPLAVHERDVNGLGVNTDADADVGADAYVETLQTIVVKPWIDRKFSKHPHDTEFFLMEAVFRAGLTPLHWAVDRGFRDIVTALLDNGADIDVQDEDMQTPLHYACSCQYREIATLLLDRGANTTLRDAEDELPYTNFLNE